MDLILIFLGLLIVVALRVLASARASWRLALATGVCIALTGYSCAGMLLNADQSAAVGPPASRRFASVAIGFEIACVVFLMLAVACLVMAWRRRPARADVAR
jgi:hypothetical protein